MIEPIFPLYYCTFAEFLLLVLWYTHDACVSKVLPQPALCATSLAITETFFLTYFPSAGSSYVGIACFWLYRVFGNLPIWLDRRSLAQFYFFARYRSCKDVCIMGFVPGEWWSSVPLCDYNIAWRREKYKLECSTNKDKCICANYKISF